MLTVKDYIPLVEFLGKILSKYCEVVLHDLNTPEHSIVAIANGEISGRQVGGPVTDLLLKVLKNGDATNNSYYSNYHGKNINGHICLCSSYFIHDEQNRTIGVLCINKDISKFLEARKYLTDNIICDDVQDEDLDKTNVSINDNIKIFENLQGSADDVIDTLIDKALAKYKVGPERLSQKERMNIAQELDGNGLFLLKGGITVLSERLNISEPTIYRYLGKLRREKDNS